MCDTTLKQKHGQLLVALTQDLYDQWVVNIGVILHLMISILPPFQDLANNGFEVVCPLNAFLEVHVKVALNPHEHHDDGGKLELTVDLNLEVL